MPTVAESFETILGLGYSGYAQINGLDLLLTNVSKNRNENLAYDAGNPSNLAVFAGGRIPVLNRSSLTISMTMDCTPYALTAAFGGCLTWRSSSLVSPMAIYLIDGVSDGTLSEQAWLQSAQITAAENQLVQVTLNFICYVWTEFGSTAELQRQQSGFDPNFYQTHQPLPFWAATCEMFEMPGVPLSFALTLDNNYEFEFLAEGTILPAPPRVVRSGNLDVSLQINTLRKQGTYPDNVANSVLVTYGGVNVGPNDFPEYRLSIPLMVRESWNPGGIAGPNSLLTGDATWKMFGQLPSITIS